MYCAFCCNLGNNSNAEIDIELLSSIVRTLAFDVFEGRAPGGEDGKWPQAVPLIHTQIQGAASVQIETAAENQSLEQVRDIEFSTTRPVESIDIQNADIVFVGFGANAPERDWDDFGDIDLNGKGAIFLVNDPNFAAASDEPVASRFGNRRITHYGWWACKFEEAALVIHETEAAGYGWNVASSSPGENYSIVSKLIDIEPVMLRGWLHGDAADTLFEAAGLNLQLQRELARRPEFSAFELDNVSFSADLTVAAELIMSQNVLAVLPGSSHAEESIMVSAHWDAYGLGEPDEQGRTVRPGANDDALGVAGVLELARVLSSGAAMDRSVVFAAWTAEESGLLGSESYANNPLYPLGKTVANLTLDILQTAGPARCDSGRRRAE